MRVIARRFLLCGWFPAVLASPAGTTAGVAQRKSSMEVIVRLHRDSALAFHSGGNSAGRVNIEAVLARFGTKLVPMYPGITDPELGSWFVVPDVPKDQAVSLAAALRDLPGIAAAYPQPRPEPA